METEVEILLVEDNPNDAEMTIRALRKNKILNNGNIRMDANMDRAQFTNHDFCGFSPKTDPLFQPRLININRAFMAKAEEIVMDVFQKFVHTGIDQVIPVVLKALPHALLLFRPVLGLG